MGDTIPISQQQPVAKGRKRLVFDHPDDSSLLIKVLREEALNVAAGRIAPWSALSSRYYGVAPIARELREFVRANVEQGGHPGFLQRIVGFVDTDLGLGVVARAERDRDGRLAPTMQSLLEKGRVDEQVLSDLSRFCDAVLESRIVVSDLNSWNIVYSYRPGRGRRFVLVDGTGDKTLIPILRMSPLLRQRAKRRKIAKLMTATRRAAAEARPALGAAQPA